MPNMNHATDILRVKQIAIDEDGNVTKRFPRIDAEGQLKNTLLFAMHPEICVLSMQVPGGLLDAYEQEQLPDTLEDHWLVLQCPQQNDSSDYLQCRAPVD